MGYKSYLRSAAAASRRREREAVCRQRELERQRKRAKMDEAVRAQFEVQDYENQIERYHNTCRVQVTPQERKTVNEEADPDQIL